jgi:hypothetical protein
MLFWVLWTNYIKCLNYIYFLKNQKECINSYNWFKLFIQQKNAPFYKNKCSLDELDEKPNHTKISKSWNFAGKGYKAKDSFV